MSIKYNNQNVGLTLPGGAEAEDITYDPTTSGLTATDVQAAIDEVVSNLENKQDTLTFDDAPTASSTNPVQSGGVYTDVRTRVPNYGKGQNILRNWYFKNPVNQRGATSGTTTNNAYFLDGWKTTYGTTSGTWALTSSGLQVISAENTFAVIMQNVEDAQLNGFALTASALYSDGTMDTATLASRTSGTNQYFGTGVSWQLDTSGILRRRVYGTQTIVAIKLELGTEQTLAHQENGTWVLNEISDYEEELLKCQTSTADATDIYANKVIATNVSNPNIFRNWYWKNPVNQRGQNSYTFSSASYGIDAWKMNRGTITITSSGLVCTWNGSTTYQTNIQNIQNYGEIAGKTITMSALSSDGTLYKDTFTVVSSGSYVTSSGTVRFAASATSQALGVNISSTTGITIVAVKAELGTEQTLAHQEGSTWVLNEIPDYEYEFYRCITSTADPGDMYANKVIATNVSKPNLLRNWYFVGGGTGRGVFPVNQRGFTTSSNVNHIWSIDGWYINGGAGTQTLNSTGLYLTHTGTSGSVTLQQWVGNDAEYTGKTMTLSTIVDGVLFSNTATIPQKTSATQYAINIALAQGVALNLFALPTSESGYVVQFQATAGKSLTVQAVKLEYGTEQTLAHQENGTWVLNEIPDYEEELIKCKTYPGYTGTIPDTYDEKSLATEQQLAPVEWGTTASRAYAVGEYFCWNGLLHRAVSPISAGQSFTPGTNCKPTTVVDEIQKKAIFSSTSSSPAVLSFGPNTRAIIFATSTNAGGRGIFSTSTNSSSTASVSALVPGNAITMTASGSTITVSSSTNVVYEILMLAGSLPTIS